MILGLARPIPCSRWYSPIRIAPLYSSQLLSMNTINSEVPNSGAHRLRLRLYIIICLLKLSQLLQGIRINDIGNSIIYLLFDFKGYLIWPVNHQRTVYWPVLAGALYDLQRNCCGQEVHERIKTIFTNFNEISSSYFFIFLVNFFGEYLQQLHRLFLIFLVEQPG